MGFHGRGRGHWHHMGDQDDEYERQVSDRELAVRLLKYTLRARNKVLLLGLVVLANTGLGLVPPYLFSLAIDKYIASMDVQGLTLPGLAALDR